MNGLTELFVTILDMSVKAIVPILYVLIAKRFLRLPSARRKWAYMLWIVVALRLIFPSFPKADSTKMLLITGEQSWIDILPQSEDYEDRIIGGSVALQEGDPNYDAVIAAGAEPITYGGSHYVIANSDGTAPAMTIGDLFPVMTVIWLTGMGVMVLWNIIAMLRLHKRLEEAVPIEDGVYVCDHIQNAFITGIGYYDIYLPSNLTPEQQRHILAHERVHLQHSDPVFRALAFVLLCVHWFNPFVWLAFHYAMNDMEATCDETVFTDMDDEDRAAYAQTLLELSTGHRPSVVAPLSFGETHLEHRIKHIFAYKAPGDLSMFAVIFLFVYAIGTCLTDPAVDYFTLADNADQVPQAVIELAADRAAGSTEPINLFLARSKEFEDFAEDVMGTPIIAYAEEKYPAGIMDVRREQTCNGIAVVFYTAEDTGFYYIQHDPPLPAHGADLRDFDRFLLTAQTTQITAHWYSFEVHK